MVNINLESKVSGLFASVEVLRDGKVVRKIEQQPNLITNTGLSDLSGITSPKFLRVGTGSSTPQPTDTSLNNQIGFYQYPQQSGQGVNLEEGYCYTRCTWTFTEGSVVGNVSELGLSTAQTGNLFNRALIRDVDGQPTSITVLSDEQLRVTWEFQVYWPTEDGEVTLENEAVEGEFYTFTSRPLGLPYWIAGRVDGYLTLGNILNPASTWGANHSTQRNSTFIEGEYSLIPADASTPVSMQGIDFESGGALSRGASSVTHRILSGLTQSNTPNRLGGLIVSYRGSPGTSNDLRQMYQIKIDPPLPKDATKKLELDITLSWARYEPEDDD